MLNDVAFGQYYPVDSFIHRMDARSKILLSIAYMVAIFLVKSFACYSLLALYLAVKIFLSKIPLRNVVKSVKAVLFLAIFTALINLFFVTGTEQELLVEWWVIKIYSNGLISAGKMIFRLMLLVMGASLLTLTTSPVEIADGIESLLYPLKWIKFPVHEFALIMSIALRFIPSLLDETDRIIKAQKARGADFESGNIFKRAKALIPVLIPLLISSFRRADELADAMDSRCYSGSKVRTKYKKMKVTWRDLIGTVLIAGLIVGVVFLNKFYLVLAVAV